MSGTVASADELVNLLKSVDAESIKKVCVEIAEERSVTADGVLCHIAKRAADAMLERDTGRFASSMCDKAREESLSASLCLREDGADFCSHEIEGRGLILYVNRNDHPEVENLCEGDLVSVGADRLFRILDIKRASKPLYRPLPGDNYGLVVTEIVEGEGQ